MSARWRKVNNVSYATTKRDDYVTNSHDEYNADYLMDDANYLPGGVADYGFANAFPNVGQRIHTEADSYRPQPVPVGVVRDQVDWEIGGERGLVDNVPYTLGVVESNTVENFDLRGAQAVIRSMPNPSATGDVRTSDSNQLLAAQFAQMANNVFPTDASRLDIVRSV